MTVQKKSKCMLCGKFGVRGVAVFRVGGQKKIGGELRPIGWAHAICIKIEISKGKGVWGYPTDSDYPDEADWWKTC